MSNRQYIELVDFTGRQLKPGKHGTIDAREPWALRDRDQWTGNVRGIGSGG